MAKFDFTKTFTVIGNMCLQKLRKQFPSQVDLAGSTFSERKIAKAVKLTVAGKKGKQRTISYGAGKFKRLFVTQSLAKNGFQIDADATGVTVGASTATHPTGGVSYADIVRYNSKGQSECNPYIVRPPAIFPNSPTEVSRYFETEIKRGAQLLITDMNNQLKEQGLIFKKQEYRIG